MAYLSTQEARLRDGRHARVVSGPLINLEETSTPLLPSLPPSSGNLTDARVLACYPSGSHGDTGSLPQAASAPRAMPRGRRPKNRQQIAPSFAVPHVRRPRSRGRRERRGAADPGDEDPGDERARNRPDPLSLGSALRGAALALLLCRERHDGSPAEARDSSVSRIAMVT